MKSFKYLLVIFSCVLILDTNVFSQNNSLKLLNNAIEELNSDISMKHASEGIIIRNIATGKTIYELNAEQSLIPASVMKVPLTAAALSILGAGTKFTTKLGYSGTVDKSGTLEGNIFIIGGGDPSFGTSRFGNEYTSDSIFAKWYKALADAGIKKVDGSVIADAGIFDDELIPRSWLWDDIGNYYGAGACGLNINENSYSVIFQPAANEGGITKVLSLQPELSYMTIINKVTTGKTGSGDNVIIYGAPFSNTRTFEGTIPSDKEVFEVKGSMPDPSYYCAYAFHYFLNHKNIICSYPPSTVRILTLQRKYTKTPLTIISTHSSPAIEKIIMNTNIHSINSYAEALLKMIGFVKAGEGSTIAGIKAVEEFWKSKNIDISGLVMNDGSGLSPIDRITARQLVEMLEFISKDNSIYTSFLNSLPVAGISGSIREDFKGTLAENNLRAKSGYMNNVRAYAGYLKDKKGQQIAFAILINNFDDTPKAIKDKIESILIRVAELE